MPEPRDPPRVGWKQCAVASHENYKPIQDAVANLHLALTAAKKTIPQHFALFVRDASDNRTDGGILLLSPTAAVYADQLPGEWIDATEVGYHGWALLYGDAGDRAALGLRSSS